jgi:SAM-dependent methyltransferase
MKTKCCFCGTFDNSSEVFPANFDSESFSAEIFSARRVPDRRYFRWVSCKSCGQYRSDPVEPLDLEALYTESTFDYSDESKSLEKTYLNLISSGIGRVKGKSILEIGGGNGFVLDLALRKGSGKVLGVEPSTHAVESASEAVKPFMITSMFKRGVVPDGSFDCAAMFHVLDHLPEPLETLEAINEALKPGGVVVIAVHNVNSWSAKLFKSKSPIFDVEHTYLYSGDTAVRLLQKAGFEKVRTRSYVNIYSFRYLIQLLPIPSPIKGILLNGHLGKILSRISVPAPLGNMAVIGTKRFPENTQ